jgi:RNA-directed DNA polymerase
MTASALPLHGDVVRRHHRQRCAQKPGPIAGSKLFTRDARRELYDIFGNFVGSVISPLLANVYLHELDKYMKRYTDLPRQEKRRRRRQGLANYTYVRYADDFVVLCNGTREQAEALKEELYSFLKENLALSLSKEKTRITHLNDGFKFLGFWIYRDAGSQGMVTKVTIPKEAMDRVQDKIELALAPGTQTDSVIAKILARKRLIGGWCRYYQYTGKASSQFSKLAHTLFRCMAHWLGRKSQLSMPEVMRRFSRNNTFVTGNYRLLSPTEFSTLHYKQRFLKPIPYLTEERQLSRENLPIKPYWTGYEARPGMADLRPAIRERDEDTCQRCGVKVTASTSEVDHLRPVRRFKRPIDANVPENLWTLCIACHDSKTKADQQVESRVR